MPLKIIGLPLSLSITPYNQSIGAQVIVKLEDGSIIHEHVHPIRGYRSQSDSRLRIGIGNKKIKSVSVYWPNGKSYSTNKIELNKEVTIDFSQSNGTDKYLKTMTSIVNKLDFPLSHIENKYDDYKREILLPHKMSSLGPCMAIADVNGDGLEDIFIGGSAGFSATIGIQTSQGGIVKGNYRYFC